MALKTDTRYRIRYQSGSGEVSERTIDVLESRMGPNGAIYLIAYCHLRKEERTFRADRILSSEIVPTNPSRPAAIATSSRPSPARSDLIPRAAAPAPNRGPLPSIAAGATRPTAAAASPATRESPHRRLSGAFVVCAILFQLILAASILSGKSEPSRYVPSATVTNSNAPVSYASVPKPAPSPPPKPAIEETTIGGLILRTVRSSKGERYEVPHLGLITTDKLEAIAAIRLPAFVERTGLCDPGLIGRYLEADLNRSGKLSFDELRVFQKRAFTAFRYESNRLALRPDEFLEKGGGDCEDFALYTAGLLRFWGWEPYIGSLRPDSDREGHAVCLSYEGTKAPDGFTYFEIGNWSAMDGTALSNGRYIPIDYDHVGSLSNAVGTSWKLKSVYIPEKAWGLEM